MARSKLTPEQIDNARRQGQRVVGIVLAKAKQLGMNQLDIAEALDMSPPNLSQTLRRMRDGRFTLKTLAKLGLAVGIYWDMEFVPMRPTTPEAMTILFLAA